MYNINEKTFEILENSGLNWTVKKEQLFREDGTKTDAYGLFRSDNGRHLGTATDRYTPYQNFEMIENLLVATSELGLTVTNAGSLKDGRLVYAQIALPDEYVGRSGLKRNLTGMTSHDTTKSTAYGSSSTVVICQNTYYKAHKQLQKFKHTESAKDRIIEYMKQIRFMLTQDVKMVENFKRMADKPLKDEIIADLFKNVLEIDMDKPIGSLTAPKQKLVDNMLTSVTKEIELEGKTVWALFNAITRYTNHMAVKPEKKNDYIMLGQGFQLSNMAYNDLLKWIDTPSLEEELVLV